MHAILRQISFTGKINLTNKKYFAIIYSITKRTKRFVIFLSPGALPTLSFYFPNMPNGTFY